MTCVWQASTQSTAPKPLTGPRVKRQPTRSRPPPVRRHITHLPALRTGASPVCLHSIRKSMGIFMHYIQSIYLAASSYKMNSFFQTVYHWLTVHHAPNWSIQAKWHNISVCFHCSQKEIHYLTFTNAEAKRCNHYLKYIVCHRWQMMVYFSSQWFRH